MKKAKYVILSGLVLTVIIFANSYMKAKNTQIDMTERYENYIREDSEVFIYDSSENTKLVSLVYDFIDGNYRRNGYKYEDYRKVEPYVTKRYWNEKYVELIEKQLPESDSYGATYIPTQFYISLKENKAEILIVGTYTTMFSVGGTQNNYGMNVKLIAVKENNQWVIDNAEEFWFEITEGLVTDINRRYYQNVR